MGTMAEDHHAACMVAALLSAVAGKRRDTRQVTGLTSTIQEGRRNE
jgi:hypothetical protein